MMGRWCIVLALLPLALRAQPALELTATAGLWQAPMLLAASSDVRFTQPALRPLPGAFGPNLSVGAAFRLPQPMWQAWGQVSTAAWALGGAPTENAVWQWSVLMGLKRHWTLGRDTLRNRLFASFGLMYSQSGIVINQYRVTETQGNTLRAQALGPWIGAGYRRNLGGGNWALEATLWAAPAALGSALSPYTGLLEPKAYSTWFGGRAWGFHLTLCKKLR